MENLKNINLLCGVCFLLFLLGCKEDVKGPLFDDSIPPAPVTNVIIENGPGSAIIRFTPPADNDLLYVKAQFTNNPFVTDGEANWDDTAEAVGFDLSADINGDLKVNSDDVLAVQRIICVADFSGDGSVNTQDVLAFLNAWNSGLDSADINLDGNVNTQDVLAFLNLWNSGC